MKLNVSAIILTFNEAPNIRACLESIKNWCGEIIIVDSFSNDQTLEIAKEYNSLVFQHEFQNQAEQFNWALDNIEIKGDWILKLDADEYVLPELRDEIIKTLPQTPMEITGFYIKRRVYFMGRWIRYGGYYPIWFLRLWRKGCGRSEERKMDEHIVLLKGKSENLKSDFVDDNKKGLKAWIQKHKSYASREAAEILAGNYGGGRKRSAYYKLPIFFRVFLYFIYRYFLRLGFLDGIAGFMFHFLQGFWYRFLADVKIYNLIKQKKQNGGL